MRSRLDPSSEYHAGRSVVISRNGMAATSHPLATLAGIQILLEGGNAVDASVAVAAALNVAEPMMTGIGGDMFALVYNARDGKLSGLNGSGRSPYALDLDYLSSKGLSSMPAAGMLPVTVPGALDGWVTLLERYGTMSLGEVLAPAIRLAEEGVPVAEYVHHFWQQAEGMLRESPEARRVYLRRAKVPALGSVVTQHDLARTFHLLAEGWREVFYRGEIAEKIVRFSEANGGVFSLRDFADHRSTWVEPIRTTYRGYEVVELPPNGQGMVALEALNILAGHDLGSMGHNSGEYLHLLIEAMKLALADGELCVADPEHVSLPLGKYLSKRYAAEARALIAPDAAMNGPTGTGPVGRGDTVYLTVVDGSRNAVSFINSLFDVFGSGMVVNGTGICLHNRGRLFSTDPDHPNCLRPHKRPYHTIIPAMMLRRGRPQVIFGVMGGFMQPQGHVQVVANLVDFRMNLQEALEAPRFRFLEGREVALEDGISAAARKALRAKGHRIVKQDYGSFGGAQAICIDWEQQVLLGASDPRKDGCAIGY